MVTVDNNLKKEKEEKVHVKTVQQEQKVCCDTCPHNCNSYFYPCGYDECVITHPRNGWCNL